MSIEKIKHLKDGDVIYVPMVRKKSDWDNESRLRFDSNNGDDYYLYLKDKDVLTEQELREKLGSDEIKFGEMVEVPDWEDSLVVYLGRKWDKYYTLWYWDGLDENDIGLMQWDSVKKIPRKTTLTLSEIEEKLGMASGGLIIKDYRSI